METLVCWKCGKSVADLPLPLGRSAECSACRADLHVCRMCSLYDPQAAKGCREPVAEMVRDKERANFCDYFKARHGTGVSGGDAETKTARSQLDGLFGGPGKKEASGSGAGAAKKKLDDFFK